MGKGIVMAAIVAAAILVAAAAMIFFSPYQTCLRFETGAKLNGATVSERGAEVLCYERGNSN